MIANGFENDALKILKSKKNLRIIDANNFKINEILKFTSINEAILTQSEDLTKFNINNFKIVSKKNQIKIN